MSGQLITRRYPVGGSDILVVSADRAAALDTVDYIPSGTDTGGVAGMRLFILAGERSIDPGVSIPDIVSPAGEYGDTVHGTGYGCRWIDLYGKAAAVIDEARRTAIVSLPYLDSLHRDFTARMIVRPIIDRLAAARGFTVMHAAGVVDGAGGGCLIAGDAGTGKTTLLRGLIDGGFRFFADDRVFVRCDKGVSLHAIPEYIRETVDVRSPKARTTPPGGGLRTCRPSAIIILGRGDAGGVRRLGPAEAAVRLLDLCPFPRKERLYRESFECTGILCNSVPCYFLGTCGGPEARLSTVLSLFS